MLLVFMILSGLFTERALAQNPADFDKLIKNPPAISVNNKKGFQVPNGESVILENEKFISLITITRVDEHDRALYQFWTYSKIFKKEITGKGSVFEHYYRITTTTDGQKSYAVIDKGSVLNIDAGIFKVEWSAGNYLYFNHQEIKANIGDFSEYQKRMKSN